MPEFKITEERQTLIKELISQLPAFRKRLRISQSDLASKIGKSRQTVSDIERNVAPMGWDTYLAVIKVLEANSLFQDVVEFDYKDRLNAILKISH